MNDKLELALAQLIEKSMTGVDKSIDFLSAEIPDVVYQLLMWYGVKSAITCGFALLVLITLIYINKKIYKITKNNLPLSMMVILGGVISNLVGVIFFFVNINLTWLQIWIAPKVWLLDYANSFVK